MQNDIRGSARGRDAGTLAESENGTNGNGGWRRARRNQERSGGEGIVVESDIS